MPTPNDLAKMHTRGRQYERAQVLSWLEMWYHDLNNAGVENAYIVRLAISEISAGTHELDDDR